MKEIGSMMKTTRLMVLSDATDAPPNVGTSYLAHLIVLMKVCDRIKEKIHHANKIHERLATAIFEKAVA